MQILIDADLVAYRCAASANGEPQEIAVLRCDKLMRQLIEETNATSYRAFLSGDKNFRKEIDPEYKANRKDQEPPIWLQHCREFLITEWKAEVQDGIEADDALGINQSADTTIVSLDKDLLQVPGNHYRWSISGTTPTGKTWVKDAEHLNIGEFDGLVTFYTSSLVGDTSDNISGIHGLGPVKAKKYLSGATTEQELFDICRALYNDDERYFKNLKLLWVLRDEARVFNPEERGLLLDDAMD